MRLHLLLAGLCLAFVHHHAAAKDSGNSRHGYRIQVNFKNTPDTMVFLAHYYGKPLPTIYKADSARIGKNGVAVFNTTDSMLGGIYMMLLSDSKTYFEFLLNDGDDMTITVDKTKLPDGIVYKNSEENAHFQDYINFLKGYSASQDALEKEMASAKSHADTQRVREKAVTTNKQLLNFRKEYRGKYPGSLLASIFGSLEVPDVPEDEHFKPDGTKDSTFPYTYYKKHFWDGFNFNDNRLMHTPVYDAKLEEYFHKLVAPVEDSIIKEADNLLAKTRNAKELFKYTLWWITRDVEGSKIMGMDRVFVYLVESYYMKGDAYWLNNEDLGKYYDRASKITPNLIGRVAPEIKMEDIKGVQHLLSSEKGKYTVVVFWDPTCGHCVKEIPQIDSVYKAVLKGKGVKMYGVKTEGDEKLWQDFIKKNDLLDWTHVYDPEHKSNFREMYDVYSTPVVYVLDEKKIIRGKRIDHTNLVSIIEMMERKSAAAKN